MKKLTESKIIFAFAIGFGFGIYMQYGHKFLEFWIEASKGMPFLPVLFALMIIGAVIEYIVLKKEGEKVEGRYEKR